MYWLLASINKNWSIFVFHSIFSCNSCVVLLTWNHTAVTGSGWVSARENPWKSWLQNQDCYLPLFKRFRTNTALQSIFSIILDGKNSVNYFVFQWKLKFATLLSIKGWRSYPREKTFHPKGSKYCCSNGPTIEKRLLLQCIITYPYHYLHFYCYL